MFDNDKSGYINTRELLTVMRAFKQDPTQAEVQELMKKLDTNGKLNLFFFLLGGGGGTKRGYLKYFNF